MNVYQCCYRGIIGYGCRTRGKRWMFVPELGQPDNRIYKDITLHDLQFRNFIEKNFELECEHRSEKGIFMKLLKSLVFGRYRPQTVNGLLFYRF